MPLVISASRLRIPRQNPNPTGNPVTDTINYSSIAAETSLITDPSHSGTISGLPTPTLVVTTTPSTSTAPSSAPRPTKTVSTPAIIGLAVAAFVFLACSLVVFMVVRGRRRTRSHKATRSSWRAMAVEERQHQQSITQTSVGGKSFLSFPTRGAVVTTSTPTFPRLPVNIGDTSNSNTFTNTPGPSITRLQRQSLPNIQNDSMRGIHTVHIPQYHHVTAPSIVASSLSNYSDGLVMDEHGHGLTTINNPEISFMGNDITKASSVIDFPQASSAVNPSYSPIQERTAASKSAGGPERIGTDSMRTLKADHKLTRARELKAMQDLISALDHPSTAVLSSSSPSGLRVDTTPAGMSRLSMGESIVTPGGDPVDSLASNSSAGFDNLPLPSADVFRAALSFGSQRKS